MAQVPELQPINFQYKNPANAPRETPITNKIFFLRKFIFNNLLFSAAFVFYVFKIFLGGIVAINFLANPNPVSINAKLAAELSGYGITNFNNLIPAEILNWQTLFSVKGMLLMVAGGFLIGFGTRYAGGCTSGHAIMGLSNLQLPSLIATICFMVGGFIMANFILPAILSL